MKVFISWSGSRSQAVASALKDWLPIVLENVEPWVSDKDISAGERWAQSVAGELEAANFGIICITPENVSADWILFEFGALSKSMQDAKVIPLLFDLDFSDISGPIAQFQAKKIERDGMREVVLSINRCTEKPTAEEVVRKRFDPLYGDFEERLKNVPAKGSSDKAKRTQSQVLEELVSTVRSLEARFRDFTRGEEMPSRRRNQKRLIPDLMFEFFRAGRTEGAQEIVLPALAGLLREDAPWASEVLLDANRDLLDTHKARQELGRRRFWALVALVEMGHPLLSEAMGSRDFSISFVIWFT